MALKWVATSVPIGILDTRGNHPPAPQSRNPLASRRGRARAVRRAGFTKGAIYRHFPSKGAFLLALFEQYAAVARAGSGARQATWFIPLTVQFAAQATRDPLLRRRFATVLSEAPDGSSPEGQLLRALARLWPA